MERYKNNGLCEFLKERYKGNEMQSELRFFDTDKSLLVVASKQDSMPLGLIIDDRVEQNGGEECKEIGFLSEKEKTYGNECYKIARQAGLPLFWVRYVDCEILRNEDFVYLWHSKKKDGTFEQIQLKTMVEVFKEHSITAELEYRTPQKQKNDSLSSAFHLWQRECLKIGIFTDLDLIRVYGGRVVEVIELKRSFRDFNSWAPYEDDFNNFAILSNFCHKLGDVDLHIVFNTQIKRLPYGTPQSRLMYYRKIEKKNNGTYYDKIDLLKLYKIERRKNAGHVPSVVPVLLGPIELEKFLDHEEYRSFITEKQR